MIATGVLQGDLLAPFLFIICLDFALRTAISDSDGLILKRRRSRRYPAETLADVDYSDDIALLEIEVTSWLMSADDFSSRVARGANERVSAANE